jgi:hypothetical protein
MFDISLMFIGSWASTLLETIIATINLHEKAFVPFVGTEKADRSMVCWPLANVAQRDASPARMPVRCIATGLGVEAAGKQAKAAAGTGPDRSFFMKERTSACYRTPLLSESGENVVSGYRGMTR